MLKLSTVTVLSTSVAYTASIPYSVLPLYSWVTHYLAFTFQLLWAPWPTGLSISQFLIPHCTCTIFFLTPTNSLTHTRCPTIQFHPDTNQLKGLNSTRLPPFQMSVTNTRPLVLLTNWYLSEFLQPHPQVWWFARIAHRTQENTLLMFTRLLQRIQHRDTQMEEMIRARYVYGRGVHGASRPSVGTSLSQHLNVFTIPEASWTPLFKSFYRAQPLALPSLPKL